MSVAFTKEDSAETASETILPDRPVSAFPNLVTTEGLRSLEAQLQAAQQAYEEARLIEDVNQRRQRAAIPVRDMRYFSARLRSAVLVPAPTAFDQVGFGHRVTYSRPDGRVQTFRIVGEDEADPKAGTLSHASPVAQALMGKAVGEFVVVAGQELELLSIA